MKTILTTTAAILALATPSLAVSLSELDANGDGVVTLKEVQAVYPEITAKEFSTVDTNGDGSVDEKEVRAAEKAGLLPKIGG